VVDEWLHQEVRQTSKKLIFSTIQGMAGEAVNPLGDLFVSLAPTIAEARRWGGQPVSTGGCKKSD
jgi:hypothetical protein